MRSPATFGSLCVTALALFFAGCQGDRGPQGPPGCPLPIFINAQFSADYNPDGPPFPPSFFMTVAESPSVPSATINGAAYQPSPYLYQNIFRFTSDNLSLAPGDSLHLQVDYLTSDSLARQARSDLVLPGNFGVVWPDTGGTYSLPRDSDFVARWTRSSGANAYDCALSLRCWYIDSLGQYNLIMISRDTLQVDTEYIVSAALIFPDSLQNDSLEWSFGGFSVEARTGPVFPGMPGNVAGDGSGTVFAATEGRGLTLTVGTGSSNLIQGGSHAAK